MTDDLNPSTQKVKKSSDVKNPPLNEGLVSKATALYDRFVRNQLEHAIEPRKSPLGTAIDFFGNPAVQLEAVNLLQSGFKSISPLLKAISDPFNSPAPRQNIDKNEPQN